MAQGAAALGVAVVPDSLLFNNSEESFRIINPNNESITFQARGEHIHCQPEEGELTAEASIELACRADKGASGDSVILVETEAEGQEDKVGMIPAVGVRVRIIGNDEPVEETTQKGSIENKASPSTTEGSVQKPYIAEGQGDEEEADEGEGKKEAEGRRDGGEGGEEEKSNLASLAKDMKMEMVTIALLTAAILGVLAYSHVRDRRGTRGKEETKGEKYETNGCPDASSTQDAQDGLSSASGEASRNLPSQETSHASQARNQQPLSRWISP